MISIDKTDALYKYLQGLGVEDINETYTDLATAGRYKREDIISFWSEFFRPSITQDLDESELEKVVDYYVDLKTAKKLSSTQLKQALKEYKATKNIQIKEQIINSQLKDVLYMCLNYCSTYKQNDVQDIVQIANIGIIYALEKYNETAKIDFKDYLIYYIRKTIIEEFGEKE